MQNGYAYDEIDVELYMTPPALSDGEEVDPMVELEELEREEAERLAMEAEDKPVVLSVVEEEEEAETVSSEAEVDVCMASDDADASSMDMEMDAASEDVASRTDSDSTSSTPEAMDDGSDTDSGSASANTSDANEEDANANDTIGNDANADTDDDDEIEILWSGQSPPRARDAAADAANTLLVHACSCDAPRRCRDAQFGELCEPMKRLLRSACWASHNDEWLVGRVAERLSKLLGYHSLHCDARSRGTHACAVPLCAELSRGVPDHHS
jgi:hypothetical protein